MVQRGQAEHAEQAAYAEQAAETEQYVMCTCICVYMYTCIHRLPFGDEGAVNANCGSGLVSDSKPCEGFGCGNAMPTPAPLSPPYPPSSEPLHHSSCPLTPTASLRSLDGLDGVDPEMYKQRDRTGCGHRLETRTLVFLCFFHRGSYSVARPQNRRRSFAPPPRMVVRRRWRAGGRRRRRPRRSERLRLLACLLGRPRDARGAARGHKLPPLK